MTNEFFRRLLLTATYWIGAMCLIHLAMATDPGYQGNWVYVFTGTIVWIIALIFKIAFFAALGVGAFYLMAIAVQAHNSWQEEKTEEAMKKNNEEVAKRNAAQDEILARKRELRAIADKKRKDQELEEYRKKRHHEKYGPRNEDDALAKAMSAMKFGDFE